MPTLSSSGQELVQRLSQQHGVSTDAVTHMLIAVQNGNGTMAQFCHPEFGGSGQWMQGGMTMVSDLFNNQLKANVDNICSNIASELANHHFMPVSGSFQSQNQGGSSSQQQGSGNMGSGSSLFLPDPDQNWWPQDLGSPNATGAQNNTRYAYFSGPCRLAVKTGGDIWVYDTLHHQIGGFSQQQGMGGSITFTSQYGTVNLATLPVVSRNGVATPPPQTESNQPPPPAPSNQLTSSDQPVTQNEPFPQSNEAATGNSESIFESIDKLGGLKEKGYITDDEFNAKKQELLGRL